MYKLSVCAVVKNEAPYISEWLEFHRRQGVDFFILYDNNSTDGTWEILKSYIQTGYVQLYRWATAPVQFIAYNDALALYRNKTEWMAFLDVDEFLYSPTGEKVSELLGKYGDAAAIAVHWVLYGSNGHLKKENGRVIERFTRRAPLPDRHTKAIVQPNKTLKVGPNPHHFIVRGNTVDEHKIVLKDFQGLKEPASADILRVAHYHVKSREEYFERKSTKADPGTNKFADNIEERFVAHDRNEVEDLSALKCWK